MLMLFGCVCMTLLMCHMFLGVSSYNCMVLVVSGVLCGSMATKADQAVTLCEKKSLSVFVISFFLKLSERNSPGCVCSYCVYFFPLVCVCVFVLP